MVMFYFTFVRLRPECLLFVVYDLAEFYTLLYRDHFGARYGDILLSFYEILSHSFDQREILLSHNILI